MQRPASEEASKHASEQAIKQASEQASKQASKTQDLSIRSSIGRPSCSGHLNSWLHRWVGPHGQTLGSILQFQALASRAADLSTRGSIGSCAPIAPKCETRVKLSASASCGDPDTCQLTVDPSIPLPRRLLTYGAPSPTHPSLNLVCFTLDFVELVAHDVVHRGYWVWGIYHSQRATYLINYAGAPIR